MQLLLIGLVLGIYLHDTPPIDAGVTRWPWRAVVAVVVVPKLLLASLYWAACTAARRRLGTGGGWRALRRVNRLTALLPLLCLLLFATDLGVGAFYAVRGAPSGAWPLGPRDWILLDELAVMLPTLALVLWSWWAYYPVDRRLREAALIRRADEGMPLYPVWSRRRYVASQARQHAALLFVPLLIIMAWTESLVMLQIAGRLTSTQQVTLSPLGAAVGFVLAPLLVRRLWDTVPLPPGPVRDKLETMCARYHVKFNDLLLWRTFGGMINAAVMGLFGRVRFVLLSDGLLDQVYEREVEAVMAHEIAHVRLRHLWWLLLWALSSMTALSLVGEALWKFLPQSPDHPTRLSWLTGLGYAAGLALWAWQFGWVSRRIERQADTFAARHLTPPPEASLEDPSAGGGSDRAENAGANPASGRFDAQAVLTMIGALQRVADLNHVAATRRSWRHGSIAWRQRHLRSLIGQPLAPTRVDRQVAAVKIACGVILLPTVLWHTVPLITG